MVLGSDWFTRNWVPLYIEPELSEALRRHKAAAILFKTWFHDRLLHMSLLGYLTEIYQTLQ